MWNDEIVEETRQVRDRYAAKFDYDLDAIYCDLKKQEEQDPEKFISLPPKQPEIIPQAKSIVEIDASRIMTASQSVSSPSGRELR